MTVDGGGGVYIVATINVVARILTHVVLAVYRASNARCDVQRPHSRGEGRITEMASRYTKFSLDTWIIMEADARQAEILMFAIMSMFNRMTD